MLCCLLLFVANFATNILKEIKSELIQGEDRCIPKMQVVSSLGTGHWARDGPSLATSAYIIIVLSLKLIWKYGDRFCEPSSLALKCLRINLINLDKGENQTK